MLEIKEPSASLAYFSSVALNVWGGEKTGGDYEWWYFDALCDDGNEAIVVTFLDNYVYSPIYNQKCEDRTSVTNGDSAGRVPAVAFVYFRDGKPVYRSVTPFDLSEFEASTENVRCKIGNNSFEHKAAPYGTGYAVNLDLPLTRKRRLLASFEWLSIESDLSRDPQLPNNRHLWNLAAPRSDVTGRLTVIDRRGHESNISFRGTGYHDHNSYRVSEPTMIEDWFWGRAHFPLATAVYYSYRDLERNQNISKLFMIKDGSIDVFECELKIDGGDQRTKFGLAKPENLTINTEEFELRVEKEAVIESSLCYLRFLSKMTLSTDGRVDEVDGISEYLSAAPIRNNLINRLLGRWHGRG